MHVTELRECPNPECKVPEGPNVTSAHVRLERLQHGDDEWHARCAFCHARGPRATGKAEAARLWNALHRPRFSSRGYCNHPCACMGTCPGAIAASRDWLRADLAKSQAACAELRAQLAAIDLPWVRIDEMHRVEADALLAEQAAELAELEGSIVACVSVRSSVDVAFSDGCTVSDAELRFDARGWHACNDEGIPVGWFDAERKVATHYRHHVPPKHPESK